MTQIVKSRWLLIGGLAAIGSALLWNALGDSRESAVPAGWSAVNERLEASLPKLKGEGREPETEDASEKTKGAEKAEGESAGAAAAEAEAGTETETSAAEADSGLVDLNRATAEELDALPGIGPAKARAVIDDRVRNGPFRTVGELARVKGIGPKLLDKIRQLVTVTGKAP
ncbi:competence protein ComEA [Paenibacillus darwinianus]|uniref:Competence protein ComEA n=1 Tax=Paenibacillus darwinianus TaxID=1380763 RepID=A0A9W5RYY7_9BACL|nr:ComEA family DNA-binding protein [Paenibacillus darwinianus]EXX86226.1 competence protein ComEA [Paenibacillus darwinianus]EXX86545.1 competence protein ComEA [Paenibacillus darwinianus]EXX89295.1 competence protein ComEA [Paenibacillus darwinianus]